MIEFFVGFSVVFAFSNRVRDLSAPSWGTSDNTLRTRSASFEQTLRLEKPEVGEYSETPTESPTRGPFALSSLIAFVATGVIGLEVLIMLLFVQNVAVF